MSDRRKEDGRGPRKEKVARTESLKRIKSKRSRSRLTEKQILFAEEPIERAVTEGLMIARSAVIMSVKNRILVTSLRDGLSFNAAGASITTREEIERVAEEQRENAHNVTRAQKRALRARGTVRHEHDYRVDDLEALDRRGRVYTAIVAQLETLGDDDGFVNDVVELAREHAWAELSSELKARLASAAAPHISDPDYLKERDERMRQLVEVDLAQLFGSDSS